MLRPQAATATQIPSEHAPAILAQLRRHRGARLKSLDRTSRPKLIDGDIGEACGDQNRLELECPIDGEMARLGREQHSTGHCHARERGEGKAARSREQARRRGRGQTSKQAHVHHRDRAGKKGKRDDVPDIRRGIEPGGLANARGEARLLERNEERRRPLGHHRIS